MSSHQPDDGRPPGGTSRTPHTKPPRKVQWLDDRGSQLSQSLDEHGLDPIAFETLTTALERHRSLSPPHVHNYPPEPPSDLTTRLHSKQENSSILLKRHSAETPSSGTTSPSSRDSSPRPQPRVPGNFVDVNERAGLPGKKDSDSYAQTEAARVVRSHTHKRFMGLKMRHHGGEIMHRRNKKAQDDRKENGSGVSTDTEQNAGLHNTSRSMGGGVLSALLALYNQQDSESVSALSTPERLSFELPSEEPWIEKSNRTSRTINEGQQRGRQSSTLNSQSTMSSSRASSVDSRESHDHRGLNRKKPKFPFPSSVLLSGGKPRQARSDAGVFGPLIASTGNLTGAASPISSGLQPDVRKPGYHLSRFPLYLSLSTRYTWDTKTGAKPRPRSMASDTTSLPGTSVNSPSSPSSPILEPVTHKTKWTHVLKDLPYAGSVLSLGGRSGVNTPGLTPPPTLEGEDPFEMKKYREDDTKKGKKRKRKKAEVFITRHVAKIIQRQEFILKLARAMMMFGGPSHRLQSQIQSTSHVLDIELSCLYLPDVLLVSFDDTSTSTSSVRLIRQGSTLDLGKLTDAYTLYWKVIHDQLSVADASAELDVLMCRPQMYSWWKLILFGGMCSASICSVSFDGSFIDSLILFPLGTLLVAIQLLSVRNELYSNVFEVTVTTLFSFLAAALASSYHFCYSAIAASAVVLILPGFIVLCGALELMSRNIVAGSVRLCYAVVYALFLGFGLAMGNKAFEKISGTTVFGPEDYTCSMTHNSGTRRHRRSFWAFLTVPMYPLFSSLRIQAPYNRKEILLLVAISCIGWVINHFTGTKFVGQSDIIAAVGAFSIGIISNLYAQFFSGNAYAIMITGILFQVPSGLGSGGLLNYATQQSAGSKTALSLVSVAIGLTVGLGVSLIITYPIQSRRRAAGIFSL
ncbi:DUF1212-domain-containing protein [Tricholoma matsutake]|nr:DUF1212-domain-containing protein [Tricholoma matsutake 945]